MKTLVSLFLLWSMVTSHSNAAVCMCKDGNEQALQKVIDYACASGADCTQIQQTGACFQPNTVKNHCDVAVNSYYQKKASTGATCDFNGVASISTSAPSTASSCLSSSGSTATTPTGMPVPTNSSSSSSVFPGNTLGPSGSSGFDPSGAEELSVRTTTVIILTTLAALALGV